MKSGSNVPVDNRSVETIYKSAKKDYAKKIQILEINILNFQEMYIF